MVQIHQSISSVPPKMGVAIIVVVLLATTLVAFFKETEILEVGLNKSTTVHDSLVNTSSHLLTLVTAFPQNKVVDAIEMLQTLIQLKCTSPIVLYLLYRPGEQVSPELLTELRQAITKSPLDMNVVEFQIMEDYGSGCFKPRVMQDYLFHATLSENRPQVLMWADPSTRFKDNPELWAHNMLMDEVDFTAKWASSNMIDFVHPDTYKFFHVPPSNYQTTMHDINARHFLINLMQASVQDKVLLPWFDCAVQACKVCMAPPGSFKTSEAEIKEQLDKSIIRHKHRHDQAVLSLLVHEWNKKDGHIQIDNTAYLNVDNVGTHSSNTTLAQLGGGG